ARNPLWNHYPTQDGRWIFLVMIESDRYWPELVRAVGLPALERDERFKGAVERYRNGAELIRMLDEVFLSKPLAAWTEILAQYRLIWAPVLTLAEAVQDPQADASARFPPVEHPTRGRFPPIPPPLQMSGHALDGTAPAPALSADTEALLREVGVSEEHIALLLAAA